MNRQDKDYRMIRQQHPVIHAITNQVTIHDVVNMILAAGGTAICADYAGEAAQITSICDGLLLNTGMPDDQKLQAMLASGRKANEKGIPVVLDPVGAGASDYRKKFLRELLDNIHFTCIRCNMSEAAALAGITFDSRGVEDAGVMLQTEQLMGLADRYHTLLAVTGKTDFVATGRKVYENHSGTPLEKEITGAGCMLSGIAAAGLAAAWKVPAQNRKSDEETVLDLVQVYGTCAEQAEHRLRTADCVGTASFRTFFTDEVSRASGCFDRAFI